MTLPPNGEGVKTLLDSALLKVGARLTQVVGMPLACVLLTIYLTNSSNEREKIDTTLNNLNATVEVLKSKTEHIYSTDDAVRDFQLRDDRMNNIGARITDLTDHVNNNTHRIDALEAVRNRLAYPHR